MSHPPLPGLPFQPPFTDTVDLKQAMFARHVAAAVVPHATVSRLVQSNEPVLVSLVGWGLVPDVSPTQECVRALIGPPWLLGHLVGVLESHIATLDADSRRGYRHHRDLAGPPRR